MMLQDPKHWKESRSDLHDLLDLYKSMAKRAIAAERILKKVFNDDGTFKLG